MKRFTIGLPNTNVDKKGTFKANILKAIAEQFPFFKWNKNDNDKTHSIEYAGPTDRLIFDLNNFKNQRFYAFNKQFWNPFNVNDELYYNSKPLTECKHYSPAELSIAMYKLHKYAEEYNSYLQDPGYDFINEFGEPVRIYKDFIQIGDHIIPFKSYNCYFANNTKTTKQDINIILNIVKNINITNIAA